MSNPKLILTIGISASGKSTFAEQMLAKEANLVRVSRDEYRYMWRNAGVVSPAIENLITKRVNQDIYHFLTSGEKVIYDATNLSASYLNQFVKSFNELAEIEFVVFDVDVDECIRRDALRQRKVGEEVIRKQYKNFLNLKKNYNFSPLPIKNTGNF